MSDAEYVTPEQQRQINKIQEEMRIIATQFTFGMRQMPEEGDVISLSDGAEAHVTKVRGYHVFMNVRVPIQNVVIEFTKETC